MFEAEEQVESQAAKPAKRKRKATAKWTTEMTEALINAVEERPSLWNHTLPEYKLRDGKTALWNETADKVKEHIDGELDGNECRLRWNNLRSNFRVS